MQARVKIIFYYLLEFIISIILVGIFALVIANITVYDSNYIKKTFKQNGYYNNVYTYINDKSTDNIIPSGLPESILDGFITKQQVKGDIDKVIDSVFNGKKIEVDSSKVRDELEARIDVYLKDNNIEVTDQKSLDRLLDQMEEIYTDEVSQSKIFSMYQKVVSKTSKKLKMVLIALIVIELILVCIVRFGFKQNTLSIPLITCSFILLFVCHYINDNLTIANISIWNDNISTLLQVVLYTFIKYMKTIAYLCLPVGCFDIFAEHYMKQSKSRKK